jgi:archaellum component FlaC
MKDFDFKSELWLNIFRNIPKKTMGCKSKLWELKGYINLLNEKIDSIKTDLNYFGELYRQLFSCQSSGHIRDTITLLTDKLNEHNSKRKNYITECLKLGIDAEYIMRNKIECKAKATLETYDKNRNFYKPVNK